MALSPFAILFAPTAFTDPWLTLWLVAAAWAALARRPFLAGLLLGLAVASKQQGVLGVPLVFALLVAQQMAEMADGRWRRADGEWHAYRHRYWLSAVLGFALIFAPRDLLGQPALGQPAELLGSQPDDVRKLALAPLAEWPQRAADWAAQLGYLFGLPALSAPAAGRSRGGRAGHLARRAAAGSAEGTSYHQQFQWWRR